MSSQEEDAQQPAPEKLRRKKQRACDYCRRKKLRCNGADMPDHRCSRCIMQEIDCTYEPINTRPPSKSYVQVLENRLQNMERLFAQLHPDVQIPKNFADILGNAQMQKASLSSSTAGAISQLPPTPPIQAKSDELDPSEDEREARINIMKNLKKVTVPSHPGKMRYRGKSSNMMFLQTVIQQKYGDVDGPDSTGLPVPETRIFTPADYPFLKAMDRHRNALTPYSDFPPPDLMDKLIEGYFTNINSYVPLLHRPTFEQRIKDNLHLREQAFGAVVLLVCANGSRWTDDPRVHTDDGQIPGWCWFEHVGTVWWSILDRSTVEDIQACALTAQYLAGSNTPQSSWTIIGLGLRMAQDVGYHRKKMYSSTPSVEDELKRRAFWTLLSLDRMGSFGLGRPSAIHDEDFDLDPMTECDDEYWTNSDPSLAFKQPEGKPSTVAFANCYINLLKILGFASRTIYSINKSKQTLGYVGPEWEQRIVAELDSALNKWVDTVPEHLRWDPHREDTLFMNQSATLYANYYFLQICVHRPFIPSPRKASRLPFPSLTICTNAARSCTRVLEAQFQKTETPLVLIRAPLFTSGLVLLLNIWGGKRSGLSNESAMVDMLKCMRMLKQLEAHTNSARRLWHILNGLISTGDFISTEIAQSTSVDRADISKLVITAIADTTRNGVFNVVNNAAMTQSSTSGGQDQAASPLYNSCPSSAGTADSSSSREQMTFASMDGLAGNVNMDMSFGLPVNTEELGRMPFHHGFSVPFALAPHHQQQLQTHAEAYFPHTTITATPATAPHLPASLPGGMPSANLDGNSLDLATFSAQMTDYEELLAALSAPPSLLADTQSQPMQPMASTQFASDPSTSNDADALMSTENMIFEDNMMEVWSAAPTSMEMDAWGDYLTSISGMNYPFVPPS